MSAFRLPAKCIDEIESLCSVFLWSGPDLNTRKAKIAWTDVCKPKEEGGLGLKSLRVANDVCVLKLLWRIITAKNSLWVRWSHLKIMRNNSIWLTSIHSSGSWMWKQILKSRQQTTQHLKVVIGNGESALFWYDNWSSLGNLLSLCGNKFIDMGIREGAMVGDAILRHRRRRHRTPILNRAEDELEAVKQRYSALEEDTFLWRSKGDKFKAGFNTKTTRDQLRLESPRVPWSAGIWFTHNCPKFGFIAWLALHNRLSTGDRMQAWNSNVSGACVFCQDQLETRSHLFFSCPFSKKVWRNLTFGILQQDFAADWSIVINLISGNQPNLLKRFTIRYLFQMTIYTLWRERNDRRHGITPSSASTLIKVIDKGVRNSFTSIRMLGDTRYEDGLQFWFASRPTA